MPFTPSHAVVALPFVRTPLVPAAIAVGAMTPDVPLFVRGTAISYAGTHDPRWVPGTVLLALALLVIWRLLLRPSVRELSPACLARRVPVEWDRGLRRTMQETFPRSMSRIALLVLSLLIGVASHIAWDAFTHEGRAGSLLIPALGEQWGPLAGYTWLQHGSSVVGLLILGVWLILRLRQQPVDESIPRLLPSSVRVGWWLSLPVVLALAWGTGLAVDGPLRPDFTIAHLGYRVLPPAVAMWGLLTLVLCIVLQAFRSWRPGGTKRDTPGMRP
jgi:hypothetical protein